METPRTSVALFERCADAVGVFDSGVGGLSVLRALRAELPLERFVYVADAGHAPYGERDDTHVIRRAQAITRYLVKRHRIKALVVACNTATAAAIQQLRQEFNDLPIVGIEPALKPAAKQSQTKHIGVLATRGTLNSEKFRLLLQSLHGQANFILQPCDGLASAIECDDATKIVASCAHFTGAMGPFGAKAGAMDTLVLGCTHYPFAIDALKGLVGDQVAFLEGGVPVARQTRKLLAEQDWLARGDGHARKTFAPLVCETTGEPSALQSALKRWLNWQPTVQSASIP